MRKTASAFVATLFWYILSTSALVTLRFDGSLGKGYASCSCSIETDDKIWLAAKILGGGPYSSGQVEYEGLIMGLSVLNRWEGELFRVEGDCKTAIQQMNGRALSRKLRDEYERAISYGRKHEIEFKHIHREANSFCDQLARAATCLTLGNTLDDESFSEISQWYNMAQDSTLWIETKEYWYPLDREIVSG